MKLDDGREVICTLALPLPLTLAGEIGTALDRAARRAGYEDAVMLADGTNRVVATKRERPQNRAHEEFCDGTCEDPTATAQSCPATAGSVAEDG